MSNWIVKNGEPAVMVFGELEPGTIFRQPKGTRYYMALLDSPSKAVDLRDGSENFFQDDVVIEPVTYPQSITITPGKEE